MKQLALAYNKYIERIAPEIGEEVIFSPRIKKYLLITHYTDGGVDVQRIESAEQLVIELMFSIGLHVSNNYKFKMMSQFEQKEKIKDEILSLKELLEQYIVLNDDLINLIYKRVRDTYFNEL